MSPESYIYPFAFSFGSDGKYKSDELWEGEFDIAGEISGRLIL